MLITSKFPQFIRCSSRVRAFSSTSVVWNGSYRAVTYPTPGGSPSSILSVTTFPPLPQPEPGTLNIRFALSPVNPADLNVVEGVYPSKPMATDALTLSRNRDGKHEEGGKVWVGGNEGLARVEEVGSGSEMRQGDWVIMTRAQMGTWAGRRNVRVEEVVKVPAVGQGVSEVQAATMTVNPPTAYNMLHDYAQLSEGDWVIQNGANSSVGQAVIQIAASKGIQSINLVRKRDDISELTSRLTELGATRVLTYDDLADKSLKDRIKEWTRGKSIKLGLNCVGGPETTQMTRLLGPNAHLVTYGGMSKQPLSFPTSLFIFKNLTAHGFWQTQWYATRSHEEKEKVMETLAALMVAGKLQAPEHEILTIKRGESDQEATERVRAVVSRLTEGRYGRKVLLKFEDP